MGTLQVGCCGFPVNQELYFRNFPAVEINSSFYNLPRQATARTWREKAPKGFTYALKAWQLITHTPASPTYGKLAHPLPIRREAWYGHFKGTDEVREAWEKTRRIAEALEASFVLFQTPSSFYSNQDHIADLKRFFKSIRRGTWLSVWEPRGVWDPGLVRGLCQELDLIHGVDPLKEASATGRVSYYRLHGAYEGRRILYAHAYDEAELRKLAELVEGRRAFVFFNNRPMWDDARRFQSMVLSPLRHAPRGSVFGPGARPFQGGLRREP